MPNPLPKNPDNNVTYFAETDYRNQKKKFGIKAEDRSRHMYVIGKTGMGKSTLLENMAIQDIKNGNGLAFIDPHGASAELLLNYIPEERIDDVMYFAPFDLSHPISFNVMEDVGDDKRHLVANGLMSAFKKIWVDMWSARMEYLLNNALLALMEYPDSTLLGINRMYADRKYRKNVVNNITDVSVRSFWEDEFANYDKRFMRQATAAIQNKIGQFVSNPLVRNIVGQIESSFDLREMMDSQKIIIVNLSKGRVGEDNANLLGSMLITKMYLAAMSRADTSEQELRKLPPFYFYVDEFQSFANESFADILSEARKYKLSLTIAHQYIEQMSEEVKDAVFGNVGTLISFRVGAYDAEVLEREFAPEFEAEDFVNLGFAQIYLKLMIDGIGRKPFSARTLPPIPRPPGSHKDDIIEHSRRTYGRPRQEVEKMIREWQANPAGLVKSDAEKAKEKQKKKKKKRSKKAKRVPDKKKKKESVSLKELQKKSNSKKSKSSTSKSKKSNNNKKPSKQNLNSLRDALSQALSGTENEPDDFKEGEKEKSKTQKSDQSDSKDAQTSKKKKKDKEKQSKKADAQASASTNNKEREGSDQNEADEQSDEAEGPNEIPKEKLEQLLKVDED